ncbi:hypothetical protein HYD77_03355 [Mycoplasmopsis bovis]|nr:site-specific DNA-methyltransferase [Mycoplasmopsis bovis]QQH27643.1 hypothetical protein HYE05_03535 [Mycoplasmopsis bovis]QQH28347.1 hypothetical protein HYE02_03405 [Mycoplasmopsis bovis]QQH43646.1 hypothetical protein HYD77_03355 [Mycoplasmopsis bovis]
MKTSTYKAVFELLISSNKYLSETKKLLKTKVYEDTMKLDQHLLDLLLSNQLITETFFTKTKNALVFNQNKFAKFIDSKEFLEDSYTSYANKIGLTSGDEFISRF